MKRSDGLKSGLLEKWMSCPELAGAKSWDGIPSASDRCLPQENNYCRILMMLGMMSPSSLPPLSPPLSLAVWHLWCPYHSFLIEHSDLFILILSVSHLYHYLWIRIVNSGSCIFIIIIFYLFNSWSRSAVQWNRLWEWTHTNTAEKKVIQLIVSKL